MINYYLITKPGIIFGNLVTVAAGFLLASKGSFNPLLFLSALLGLALVMASACVLNNYIDKPLDEKMERTKNRALPTGKISDRNAIIFALILGITGVAILYFFTTPIATSIAGFGFFVYVILYSGWKSHTVYGTAIGSVAGAVPPVVGYTAVSNQIDLGAWIFFAILILWQMPHFFSIALFRLEDYTKAGIPVLPRVKGIYRTKIHMVIYIIAYTCSALLLTFYNYTGYVYFWIALAGGLAWLTINMRGFIQNDDQKFGRQMFRVSLVVITTLCLGITIDRLV